MLKFLDVHWSIHLGKIVRIASRAALTLPRSLKWIAVTFLALIVLIVLVVTFFDWNWLRDPIARKISSSTGRSFAINGDLTVHLSLRPRIVANDIVLGNAAWSREPSMGALIPLLEFGKDKDSNCIALMSQARSDAGVTASDMAPRAGR